MTIQNRRIPDETSEKPAVGRLIEQTGIPLEQTCFEPGCTEQVYRLPSGWLDCLHGHQQIPPHYREEASHTESTSSEQDVSTSFDTSQQQSVQESG